MLNSQRKAHGAHTNTVCSKQGVKSGSSVYQVSFESYCIEGIDYKTKLLHSYMTNTNRSKVSHYNKFILQLTQNFEPQNSSIG